MADETDEVQINPEEVMYAVKQLHIILEDIRYGYNAYSFLFFLGGIAIILGNYFGLTGITAVAFTVAFFYSTGRLHARLEKKINGKT